MNGFGETPELIWEQQEEEEAESEGRWGSAGRPAGRHTHTHTQAHQDAGRLGRLVSGGGVGFDSNISLRDKSERELDFLLLGVRTAAHIYLHMGPAHLCGRQARRVGVVMTAWFLR